MNDNRKKIIVSLAFALDIVEACDFEICIDKDENGSRSFALSDNLGTYWGDIDKDRFDNIAEVIDRLSIYINDALYNDYDDRKHENIPFSDSCNMLIAALHSDEVIDDWNRITPDVYDQIFEQANKVDEASKHSFMPAGVIFYDGVGKDTNAKYYDKREKFEAALTEDVVFNDSIDILDFTKDRILDKKRKALNITYSEYKEFLDKQSTHSVALDCAAVTDIIWNYLKNGGASTVLNKLGIGLKVTTKEMFLDTESKVVSKEIVWIKNTKPLTEHEIYSIGLFLKNGPLSHLI